MEPSGVPTWDFLLIWIVILNQFLVAARSSSVHRPRTTFPSPTIFAQPHLLSVSGPFCSASFQKRCCLLTFGLFRTRLPAMWQLFLKPDGTSRTLEGWTWYCRCLRQLFVSQDVLSMRAFWLRTLHRKWTHSATLNSRLWRIIICEFSKSLTVLQRGRTRLNRIEYQGSLAFSAFVFPSAIVLWWIAINSLSRSSCSRFQFPLLFSSFFIDYRFISLGLDVFREEDDQLEMKVLLTMMFIAIDMICMLSDNNCKLIMFSVSGHLPHPRCSCLFYCLKTLSCSRNGSASRVRICDSISTYMSGLKRGTGMYACCCVI